MKTKYTFTELRDKKIAIKLESEEQHKLITSMAKESGINTTSVNYDYITDWEYYAFTKGNFTLTKISNIGGYTIIPASEFFLEDEPESTPEPIPTEYAVLTNATESAKKQIAEFEQVLAQIKIDAMKLGSRDLARLIKALKVI